MVYDIVLETLSFSQKAKLLDPGTFGRFLWVMGTLKIMEEIPNFCIASMVCKEGSIQED
jgi:hypothetical protein